MNTETPKSTGLVKTWLLALLLSAAFVVLLTSVMSLGRAAGHAALLFLPNFWLSRLVIAQRVGCMTRRFNFLNSTENESTLVITGARILDKEADRWAYWSNWLREAFMCLVLWLLIAPAVLTPLSEMISGTSV